MSAGIGVMRTGKKVTVMAGTGRKATVTDATGTGGIVMVGTGIEVIVMVGTGAGIDIIAITPDARRRIRDITAMAGITTGTRRATA